MSKDICKIYGKKLRNLRMEKGLSQEALALEVGLTKNAIGNYEKGIRCPHFKAAQNIAKVLDVKFSDMLD